MLEGEQGRFFRSLLALAGEPLFKLRGCASHLLAYLSFTIQS